MIFKTDYLRDCIISAYGEFEDDDGNKINVISNEHSHSSRWEETRDVVFKFNGTVYGFSYSRGLTEQQDTRPFEYDGDEIDCEEMFPTEVKTIVYMTKKQAEKQKEHEARYFERYSN